jgi:uncharacterized protein (TIGR02466 family)
MIHNAIFPLAVSTDKLKREFTDEERAFFAKCKEDVLKNAGNDTSKNNYVLRDAALAQLHDDLQAFLQEYFSGIINPASDVTTYITQSWINYTKTGGHHHQHYHSNSFISGVFYINADREKDKIFFYKRESPMFRIIPKEWNLFNTDSWFFQVGTYDIVLFPSHLSHMVESTTSDEERISLSFNTFLKGSIGEQTALTELIIGERV